MATTQHVGKAGQFAVMSEPALRGYNVAIPEIDTGDDVFAFDDGRGVLWRIQVKAATPTAQKTSRRYQFRCRESAIRAPVTPELTFVFALRDAARWRFLVPARNLLRNYVVAHGLGSLSTAGDDRQMSVTLHDDGRAVCSGVDLSHHPGDFSVWPPI